MMTNTTTDPHAQLRALYQVLLKDHEHFDEFKSLLALYQLDSDAPDDEPEEAAAVREKLNDRIRDWIGDFDGLSAVQAHLWRKIVVEERYNVSLSPWKESNFW